MQSQAPNLRNTPALSAFPAHLVTIDPEVVSGTPVFAGTRVPVKSLFDWLETETLDEFLENFPSVRREQAVAVLRFAKRSFFIYELKTNEVAA
jgi:uncharacterized protein (DUF433 family)